MISLSGVLSPLMKRSNTVGQTDVAIELPDFAKLNPAYMPDFLPQNHDSLKSNM